MRSPRCTPSTGEWSDRGRLDSGDGPASVAMTVEGEILTWKATTRTCQVKKAWRVTGKHEGVCRLRACVGSQWSAKVSLLVR